MSRVLKITAVGLLGVAFLSAAASFCPCPEMRAAASGEHDCCGAGVRSADVKPCCEAAAAPNATSTPAAGWQGTVHAPVAFATPLPDVIVTAEPPLRPFAASSSPPLILRI